jgi:hypothetical protein
MEDLRTSCLDVLPAQKLVHSWAGRIHGIENYKIAGSIASTFKSNDGNGMARLLKVNGWQQGLVDVRAVLNGRLCEIALDGF